MMMRRRRMTKATVIMKYSQKYNNHRYIPKLLASQRRAKICCPKGYWWSLELLRWTSLSRKASCKWLQPEQLPVSFLPTGQSISPYSPATTLWEDKMSQKRNPLWNSSEPVSWELRWCCGTKDLYILRWQVSSDSPRTHKRQKWNELIWPEKKLSFVYKKNRQTLVRFKFVLSSNIAETFTSALLISLSVKCSDHPKWAIGSWCIHRVMMQAGGCKAPWKRRSSTRE